VRHLDSQWRMSIDWCLFVFVGAYCRAGWLTACLPCSANLLRHFGSPRNVVRSQPIQSTKKEVRTWQR